MSLKWGLPSHFSVNYLSGRTTSGNLRGLGRVAKWDSALLLRIGRLTVWMCLMYSPGLCEQTSLWGFQWLSGQTRNSAVINTEWVRLPPWSSQIADKKSRETIWFWEAVRMCVYPKAVSVNATLIYNINKS